MQRTPYVWLWATWLQFVEQFRCAATHRTLHCSTRFTALSVQHVASSDRLTGEQWTGNHVEGSEGDFPTSSCRVWGKLRETSVRINGVQAKIRKRGLLDTNHKLCIIIISCNTLFTSCLFRIHFNIIVTFTSMSSSVFSFSWLATNICGSEGSS
jgi:hypothetical protein